MGAELRKYDEYPEEDLDFIRELEEEEEEILSGNRRDARYVTREMVPELRALREQQREFEQRTSAVSGKTGQKSSGGQISLPKTRKTVVAEARPVRRASSGRIRSQEEVRPTQRPGAEGRPQQRPQQRPARPGVRAEGGGNSGRTPGGGGGGGGNSGNRRPPSGGGGKKSLSQKFETSFQNNKPLFFFISRAMIPVIFIFYEAVFNLTTVRDFFGMHAIFIILFSVFYGLLGSLVSSIARSRKVNMIVKAIVIFIPVIPFLIEYFVYLQFKVFYDLNTVLHGAADAAGGFKADIFRLITSWQGIYHIVLYLLPTAAFLFFELKIDKKHLLSLKTGVRRKVKMAIVSVGCYLVALLLILLL